MAYCPRCGREQRCGCDKCHICGVEVVERHVEPAQAWMRAEARAAGKASRRSPVGVRVDEPERLAVAGARAGEETGAAAALPVLLLFFGCGILLVTLIEAINDAMNFPAVGTAASMADAMRRLGYYVGSLLYTASVRTITGFALVSLGLLLEPDRPFADRELAGKVRRSAGLSLFVVALLCLLSALLVVIPVGATSFIIRSLLPAKWAAISTLVAMGAALLAGGFLLMARSAERRPTSRNRGDVRRRVPRRSAGRRLANAGGDADESIRGGRRSSEGDLSGRTGPELGRPGPAEEQGGNAR